MLGGPGLLGIDPRIPRLARQDAFARNSRMRFSIAAVFRICLIYSSCALASCTGNATVKESDTVSVQIYHDSDFYLDLEKGASAVRDQRPGELALDVTSEMIQDCGSLLDGNSGFVAILAPFCVLSGAAIGATAGAIAKGTESEQKTADGNLQTAIDVANAEDASEAWRAMLQTSLEEAGRQRGMNVVAFPDGDTAYVVVEDLHWAQAPRRRWAISGEFQVATRSGDSFARQNFTVSGKSYEIEKWLANDGELLVDEMQLFFNLAASRAWAILIR